MNARDKVEQILREMVSGHLAEFAKLEAEIPESETESRALIRHFAEHLRAWTPPTPSAPADLE